MAENPAVVEPRSGGDPRIREAERRLSAVERRRGSLPSNMLDAIVESVGDCPADAVAGWLSGRNQSAATLYLQIQLVPGEPAQIAGVWERLLAAAAPVDASLLVDASRALARAGRPDAAARRLRQALERRPPYTVHARAAALVSELWAACPPAARRARIAILGATTTSFLVPVMRALCYRDGIDAEFYEAPFGAYRQEIIDRSSGLYRFAPTIAIVATHSRDVPLRADEEHEEEAAARVADSFGQLWDALAAGAACHIVQTGLDLPAGGALESPGSAAAVRARIAHRVNLQLARRASGTVSFLDQAAVQREAGSSRWQDDRAWHTARQHPALDALPALAEALMAHVRAATGLTRKVLVCDLDNTLWGGVIGEDGLDGIRLGPDSHEGEAHAALQDRLLALKEQGVVLAVCSKNDPDQARLPFERHPHTRLRLDDFAVFLANWDDKATNVRRAAAQLSLGLDSFVFLDDNPFEREWIRAEVADVAVIELGASPFSYVRDLDAGGLFFSLSTTAEDRGRAALYRVEAARRTLQETAASLDDFLAQLQMRGAAAAIGAANLPRVAQLVNKTNQFNLTTRRRSRAEIEAFLAGDGGWGCAFSLSDRFGDHGLVSVMLCAAAGPDAWEIDTWVMSCRVLGRGLERFAMEHLLAAARAHGVERLIGVYRPSGRNAVVSGLFEELGFAPIGAAEGERRFERRVDAGPLPAHHIEDVAPVAGSIERA